MDQDQLRRKYYQQYPAIPAAPEQDMRQAAGLTVIGGVPMGRNNSATSFNSSTGYSENTQYSDPPSSAGNEEYGSNLYTHQPESLSSPYSQSISTSTVPRSYHQFPNYEIRSSEDLTPTYQQELAYEQPLTNVKPTPRNLDWTPETQLWKLYEVVVRDKKVSHLALLPDWKPTPQTPSKVYLDQQRDHDGYHCLFPGGCRGKQNVFKRPADLDRHQIQVHAKDTQKAKFYCYYKRCERSKSEGTKPFFRKDHYRDHLRDFHKEDLFGKKFVDAEAKQKWLEERKYDLSWWRCGKCLEKTQVSKDEYTCRHCNIRCEDDRVSIRRRLAEGSSQQENSQYPAAYENNTSPSQAYPSYHSSCLMCQGNGYIRGMYGGWLECSVCRPVPSLEIPNAGNDEYGYSNSDSGSGQGWQ